MSHASRIVEHGQASTQAARPEWYAATVRHEIERLRRILRDPRAGLAERSIARDQLDHYEHLELDVR